METAKPQNPNKKLFTVVDENGAALQDPKTKTAVVIYAKSPLQAAKKAFYSNLRRAEQFRFLPVVPVAEEHRKKEFELDGDRLRAEVTKFADGDEAVVDRWMERYGRARERALQEQSRVSVVGSKRPRIFVFDVFRPPKWPFSRHHVQKYITVETVARKL